MANLATRTPAKSTTMANLPAHTPTKSTTMANLPARGIAATAWARPAQLRITRVATFATDRLPTAA
ncbi:hypothetical protein GCM10009681_21110 [Luedemannella helvata]|uniref:Uncharacterized protein n=1 Tax=Luedemannella helvata TaxID=349315 RepID=A0ABN2K757_9ACTN